MAEVIARLAVRKSGSPPIAIADAGTGSGPWRSPLPWPWPGAASGSTRTSGSSPRTSPRRRSTWLARMPSGMPWPTASASWRPIFCRRSFRRRSAGRHCGQPALCPQRRDCRTPRGHLLRAAIGPRRWRRRPGGHRPRPRAATGPPGRGRCRLFEIGGDQGDSCAAAVSASLLGWQSGVERDLAGLPRVLRVSRDLNAVRPSGRRPEAAPPPAAAFPIRLIALDIDGTLVGDDLVLRDRTRAAVRTALERGVSVSLVTGRMSTSAIRSARELGLHAPLVAYQGALIGPFRSQATSASAGSPSSTAGRSRRPRDDRLGPLAQPRAAPQPPRAVHHPGRRSTRRRLFDVPRRSCGGGQGSPDLDPPTRLEGPGGRGRSLAGIDPRGCTGTFRGPSRGHDQPPSLPRVPCARRLEGSRSSLVGSPGGFPRQRAGDRRPVQRPGDDRGCRSRGGDAGAPGARAGGRTVPGAPTGGRRRRPAHRGACTG